MSDTLKISIHPETLVAHLFIENPNPKVVNELRIICSNLSDDYYQKDQTFIIPWFELRRGLNAIARLRQREDLVVQYDEFTQSLIAELIEDHKSVKEKYPSVEIDEQKLEQILLHQNFLRSLKDEQKRDALKLLRLKHGANFSVPGAGKTTTVLAIHTVLKSLNQVSKLFVIAPINAFISWQDEIAEIFEADSLKVIRLTRDFFDDPSLLLKENPDVILVNYEKLRRDVRPLVSFFITNRIHLILDESHRVKSGINNLSYSQIIKLADLAKRRDILSGTPLPQHFSDLDPQFDFLWPGEMLLPEKTYIKDEDSIAKVVNEAIEGLFVRTTKNELGLDDPVISYEPISMGEIQQELYRLFKSEAARIISGMDKPSLYNFRRIGKSVVKLLQAATNPILLTSKDEYGKEIFPIPQNREFWQLLEEFQKYEKPTKIEHLRKRIKEVIDANSKNKIVIWSYFVRNILILEKLFQEYNPVLIYGGVPSGSDEDEANREGRIRKFHEDKSCKLMIANPQACGEGISLHKICHHAIYLDRNFNAAYFLQSIDRIHRLGLEKGIVTKVEILVSQNSIDETVVRRLNDKIKAMGRVLDDPYLHALAYDPFDISEEDEIGIDQKDFEAIKQHVLER